MAEQSVGHRMQLLHINRFLITIRMTAGFSIEEWGRKLKFPFGLLMGVNTSLQVKDSQRFETYLKKKKKKKKKTFRT